MKNLFQIIGLSLLTIVISFMSCNKTDRDPIVPANGANTNTSINPTNPNALTEVLVVPNSNIVNGNMPEPSGGSSSPVLEMTDTTVSYSSGSQILLPISYSDNSGSGIGGIYFQVNGSGQYFNVPVSGGTSGTMLLPIGLPSNVEDGEFCITISIYDNLGNVSNVFETCITVTSPVGCGIVRVSGGAGRTSTLHNMGSNPGIVRIDYETYTVPDRIDVFYNGLWVAGTGSNPGPLQSVPPLADCSNPTEGYVGANGTFCFTYDPAMFSARKTKLNKALGISDYLIAKDGQEHFVEVVVSGCVRGGTAWQYEISCADPNEVCMVGQDGSPRFNLKFANNVDFDLHVIDPSGYEISYTNTTSPSGGTLDVDMTSGPNGSENVYWIDGTAPSGVYTYWVHFYSGTDNSSSFSITVSENGNIISTQSGVLSNVGEESQHYTHTYN
jgi:hypothetical protein